MAEQLSDASRFQSKYGGGYVTAANFIVEMICERLALKDKLGALPVKFWNLPKWKKIYMMQLLTANSLLKMYSPTAIIAGLKRNPKCYSLKAPWLDDTFKEEEEKVKKLAEQAKAAKPPEEFVVVNTTTEKPRESFAKEKSLKSKLD